MSQVCRELARAYFYNADLEAHQVREMPGEDPRFPDRSKIPVKNRIKGVERFCQGCSFQTECTPKVTQAHVLFGLLALNQIEVTGNKTVLPVCKLKNGVPKSYFNSSQ